MAELLQPHAPALNVRVRDDDARIRDLARAGAELADEVGVDGIGCAEVIAALHDSSVILELPTGRRDDYALAAGTDAGPRGAASIARGVGSINWRGVPPRTFDAAEDTVDWYVDATSTAVVAVVRAAVIGPDPATGITVLLRSEGPGASGAIVGSGALDADGHATLPLSMPSSGHSRNRLPGAMIGRAPR